MTREHGIVGLAPGGERSTASDRIASATAATSATASPSNTAAPDIAAPTASASSPAASTAAPAVPGIRLFGSRDLSTRASTGWARIAPLVSAVLALAGLVYLVQQWRRWIRDIHAYDAHAYWAVNLAHPYASALLGARDAYLYAPVFAQVFSPITSLPWPTFYAIWTVLNLLALVYMLGPFLGAVSMIFFTPVALNTQTGNIHLMLAAAIVFGFRHPAAWSFVLLTKVTPGIGLLWFLVRGEWRALAVALGATAAIAAVSFAFAPDLWFTWFHVLIVNSGGQVKPPFIPWLREPLTLRLLAAAALVTWGALRDQRWTVPVAATLALPVVWHIGLSMLVAVIPLLRRPGDQAGWLSGQAVLRELRARTRAVRALRPAGS